MSYPSLIAETATFVGHNGDSGEAYYACPTRDGKFPGVVVVHHLPGWDEWIIEVVRKFAHHGYAAISPHLYFRNGPGSPDDVGAKVRAAGGVADDQVVGDVSGAMAFLRAQPNSSGKVGIIGFCSGGRHAYLCACRLPTVDAVIDCWGGNVIVDDKSQLNAKRPVAPIDLSEGLRCPILGLFGNDDENPNADQVNRTEAVLKRLRKAYEFHRYDGAGHAFVQHVTQLLPHRTGRRRLGQDICVPAHPSQRVEYTTLPNHDIPGETDVLLHCREDRY
jgi:carboxymethylenebutenolidase